jgi:hypothetical protein
MLKKILTIAFIIMGVFSLQAQERDETPVVSPGEVHPPVVKEPDAPSRLDVNMSVGSSFSYSKGFGNGMATYVAPELSYRLSPRFRLNVGVMLLNSNLVYNRYLFLNDRPSVVIRNKPAFSTLAYVSGDYLINDRLTISAMVMSDLTTSRLGTYSPSVQAMSLHLDYKIADHMSIGAGIHMNNGNYWGYPGYNTGYSPWSNPVLGY